MKSSRLLVLAAAQLCWAAFPSGQAIAAGWSTAWSDLWQTPDQQGQALLEAGQPAQAADRFHDPRRRAYADLRSGRYRQAAKLLAPFTDAESEYNRGNALAATGQLQGALAAYDAALEQRPADRDIRHNRDLVERALRQQQQSPRSSSANAQQGRRGAGSSGQQQGGAGQRGGSGSQQSGASGSQSAGGNRTGSSGSQTGGNQAGNSGQPGGGGIPQGSAGSQAAGASGSGTSKEAPGQAQRDAAVAAELARQQRQRSGGGNTTQPQGSSSNGTTAAAPKQGGSSPGTGGLLGGGAQTPRQKPESERQLALDQWLRQIPDSPAGLLQRKFLIEHMMKQQDSGDPQGGGP